MIVQQKYCLDMDDIFHVPYLYCFVRGSDTASSWACFCSVIFPGSDERLLYLLVASIVRKFHEYKAQ